MPGEEKDRVFAGSQTEQEAKAGETGDVAGKVESGKEETAAEQAEAADVLKAGKGQAGSDKDAGDGKVDEKKDLKTLQAEVESLAKRLGDKDLHITTLERENSEFRKSKKADAVGSSEKLSTELSARFPKEAEEIARLRLEGNDLEADDLSAKVRAVVYEERIAKEEKAREFLVNDAQERNKFGDFAKYEKNVKEQLKDIPLHILQARPDYWVKRAYEQQVGADYLALKKEEADAAAGKTGKKVDGGAGAAQISDSPGGGRELNASEQLNKDIRDATPQENI